MASLQSGRYNGLNLRGAISHRCRQLEEPFCLDKSDVTAKTCAWACLHFESTYRYARSQNSKTWPCPGEAKCISRDQICDGIRDCSNGQDEEIGLCTEDFCKNGFAPTINKRSPPKKEIPFFTTKRGSICSSSTKILTPTFCCACAAVPGLESADGEHVSYDQNHLNYTTYKYPVDFEKMGQDYIFLDYRYPDFPANHMDDYRARFATDGEGKIYTALLQNLEMPKCKNSTKCLRRSIYDDDWDKWIDC